MTAFLGGLAKALGGAMTGGQSNDGLLTKALKTYLGKKMPSDAEGLQPGDVMTSTVSPENLRPGQRAILPTEDQSARQVLEKYGFNKNQWEPLAKTLWRYWQARRNNWMPPEGHEYDKGILVKS